jgi:hypothetical protein
VADNCSVSRGFLVSAWNLRQELVIGTFSCQCVEPVTRACHWYVFLSVRGTCDKSLSLVRFLASAWNLRQELVIGTFSCQCVEPATRARHWYVS